MTDLEREPVTSRVRPSRRGSVGFILGGATLAVAADLGLGRPAIKAGAENMP